MSAFSRPSIRRLNARPDGRGWSRREDKDSLTVGSRTAVRRLARRREDKDPPEFLVFPRNTTPPQRPRRAVSAFPPLVDPEAERTTGRRGMVLQIISTGRGSLASGRRPVLRAARLRQPRPGRRQMQKAAVAAAGIGAVCDRLPLATPLDVSPTDPAACNHAPAGGPRPLSANVDVSAAVSSRLRGEHLFRSPVFTRRGVGGMRRALGRRRPRAATSPGVSPSSG